MTDCTRIEGLAENSGPVGVSVMITVGGTHSIAEVSLCLCFPSSSALTSKFTLLLLKHARRRVPV